MGHSRKATNNSRPISISISDPYFYRAKEKDMKFPLVLLGGLLLLIGCGEPEATTVPDTNPESLLVELDSDEPTYEEIQLKENADDPFAHLPADLLDLKLIPKTWEMLTEEQGELIIYTPCDAENKMVQIYFGESGQFVLSLSYGQEAEEYVITGASVDDDSKAGQEVTWTLDLESPGGEHIVAQAKYNEEEGQGHWENLGPLFDNLPMVSGEQSMWYPLVEQPCMECWEERCEGEQFFYDAYGDGVLVVSEMSSDQSFEMGFADTPGGTITKKVGVSMGGYTDESVTDWFTPREVIPDEIHMIVKNREGDWYEVELRDDGSTAWVQQQPLMKYHSWPEYLRLAFSISRNDALRNPIKKRPGQNGMIITYDYDLECFRIGKVIGKWAQVIFNDMMCNEEDVNGFKEGWIKWRDDEGLIITQHWPM